MEYISTEDKYSIWKSMAEANLEWGDVDDRFTDLQPGLANIMCPFHVNKRSPSARPYWDEDRDILVIHCFRERRTFTVFDYINLILCNHRHAYKDPGDFLQSYFGPERYKELFELARDNLSQINEAKIEVKREYIKNLYNQYDNVIDFINTLYLEK